MAKVFAAPVHPRVCGGNCPAGHSLGVEGNTPAYAGKTQEEKGRKLIYMGTPPRMRGKPDAKAFWDSRERNTPAYAGKTKVPSTSWCALMEHPRVCGENAGESVWGDEALGTPPRMRGKRARASARGWLCGNTPAYAGKTLRHQHVYEPKPDFSITSSDKPTLQQAYWVSQTRFHKDIAHGRIGMRDLPKFQIS